MLHKQTACCAKPIDGFHGCKASDLDFVDFDGSIGNVTKHHNLMAGPGFYLAQEAEYSQNGYAKGQSWCKTCERLLKTGDFCANYKCNVCKAATVHAQELLYVVGDASPAHNLQPELASHVYQNNNRVTFFKGTRQQALPATSFSPKERFRFFETNCCNRPNNRTAWNACCGVDCVLAVGVMIVTRIA